MAIITYINFRSQSEQAIDYYLDIFGGTIDEISYFKDMPQTEHFVVDKEMENLVLNAQVTILDTKLMFSDVPEHIPLTVGNNISLSVVINDFEKANKYFNQLAIDGTVVMPFAETFFSKGYGNLIDKFGIGWQINVLDR